MNKIQKARLKLNQKLETHEKEIPCFYEDPNLFDPEMFDDYHTRQAAIKSAKTLCAECPAKLECFDYGYKSSATAMIWGGATIQEINHLKYRQK
jgi:lipoate synthase